MLNGSCNFISHGVQDAAHTSNSMAKKVGKVEKYGHNLIPRCTLLRSSAVSMAASAAASLPLFQLREITTKRGEMLFTLVVLMVVGERERGTGQKRERVRQVYKTKGRNDNANLIRK